MRRDRWFSSNISNLRRNVSRMRSLVPVFSRRLRFEPLEDRRLLTTVALGAVSPINESGVATLTGAAAAARDLELVLDAEFLSPNGSSVGSKARRPSGASCSWSSIRSICSFSVGHGELQGRSARSSPFLSRRYLPKAKTRQQTLATPFRTSEPRKSRANSDRKRANS
jgi:hypothetical protein